MQFLTRSTPPPPTSPRRLPFSLDFQLPHRGVATATDTNLSIYVSHIPSFSIPFLSLSFFFRGLLEGAFVLEMPSDNLYRLRLFCAGIEQFRRHIPVRKEAETRKKMDETVRNRPLIRFIMRVRTGISHPVRRIQQV